jgi:hypothetical protein
MVSQIDRINGLIGSIAFKAPCLVSTTANIVLSGVQTIDDVLLSIDDRVLVQNQTSAEENGIYDVQLGAWQRSPDFDGMWDVTTDTRVAVSSGTVHANSVFRLSTAGEILIGTTELTFVKILWANSQHSETFVDGDLTAGVISITHGLDTEIPSSIVLYDNSKKLITDGYDIDSTGANSFNLDLSGFGTIPGTWTIKVTK